MSLADENGVKIFYEVSGQGDPVVLVHGSWGDHHNWDLVVPKLAERFRVMAYDRRGHSQSETPPGQGTLDQDVDDLAALIETLDLAPTHVAGNSLGSIITLRLASRRPELFRTLAVHEPPAVPLLEGDPRIKPMLEAVQERIGSIAAQLEAGDIPGGTRRFVEEMMGTSWEEFPSQAKETFLRNAPTWMDEVREGYPQGLTIDLDALSGFTKPALLTQGDQSPPFFGAVLDKVATVLPQAESHVYVGAGHNPHMTHPEDYVRTLSGFAAA
jgi:pimeloyl-ACP methyl ester carboxylesterase